MKYIIYFDDKYNFFKVGMGNMIQGEWPCEGGLSFIHNQINPKPFPVDFFKLYRLDPNDFNIDTRFLKIQILIIL